MTIILEEPRQDKTTYLYLALTIILWSAAPAIAKMALVELDNYNLLFYTSIFAVITLFGIILAQGKTRILTHYSLKDYLLMSGMGFLGLYLYNLLLFRGFSLAPAGQANVINYLYPVFMVIFSTLLLREKLSLKTVIAIIISFTGAVIVITGGKLNFTSTYTEGYLFACLAALCMGLFSVLGKKLTYDAISSMFVYSLATLVYVIPTTFMRSKIIVPELTSTIASIVILGVFMNSIAYVFWWKALKNGETHKIANLTYIIPLLAIAFTYFLNGEVIPLFSLAGVLLIILGFTVQIYPKK